MIKLLHLELHDECTACPYLTYGNINREFYCNNDDTPSNATIINQETLEIPDWCPLVTWVEGDKF